MSKAHDMTAPVMSESAALLTRQKEINAKQKLLTAVRNHFTLSEEEMTSLTSTLEPVDVHFFRALAKAKAINKDCEILLGFETQRLGFDLMDQISKNLHYGFQKLYKWVQREFRSLNLENPQMNTAIRQALRVLAERPTLFQNCLDFFAEARERILSDSFFTALTGVAPGQPNSTSSKPIDLTAHDPLRYVGDMLAWIHSASVSEREALEILFVAEGEELVHGLQPGKSAEIWRHAADEETDSQPDFNAVRALNELVDRNLTGAARVLRQRVEQVIQSNEEVIPAYKLANLINFYLITFRKLLGEDANLCKLVKALEIEALRQFRSLVRDHIAALQGEFQQNPSNLEPPPFLLDSLKQLDAIMRTYETSLFEVTDRESGFEAVLSEAFQPFMSGCSNMAKTMEKPGSSIFLLNCTLAAMEYLQPFEFTQRTVEQLRRGISSESDALVNEQTSFFKEQSGLANLLRLIALPANAKFTEAELAMASQKLDNFLPSALMDAMDRLKHLQNPMLARNITDRAAARFCDDFETLEESVKEFDISHAGSELPGHLRAAFPRTGAEIRVLLS